MTMGLQRNCHHTELKYWLRKIGRAVDTICRKCGIGEQTAEHVVYDCPSVHHPPHEPTPSDTLAKDPKKVPRILEKWTFDPDLPDVSQPATMPSCLPFHPVSSIPILPNSITGPAQQHQHHLSTQRKTSHNVGLS